MTTYAGRKQWPLFVCGLLGCLICGVVGYQSMQGLVLLLFLIACSVHLSLTGLKGGYIVIRVQEVEVQHLSWLLWRTAHIQRADIAAIGYFDGRLHCRLLSGRELSLKIRLDDRERTFPKDLAGV